MLFVPKWFQRPHPHEVAPETSKDENLKIESLSHWRSAGSGQFRWADGGDGFRRAIQQSSYNSRRGGE